MGAFFLFLSKVTEFFCKIESNFLNSRVLAGGFVMGCRGHPRILIKGVRNTNDTSLIVGNDGNCKGFRY